MRLIRPRRVVVAATAFSLFSASAAWGSTSAVGALQQASGSSPFAACTADDVAAQPGTVYLDSEVEPWVAASRVDRNADGAADVIAGYQQDRWSNGAARGVYASVWYQNGWRQVAIPGTSACVGGSHLRATDPWVTFSPNGAAYFFTLATSAGNDPALYVNKSVDGGLHWSPPVTLIEEDSVFNFDDRNSITADPFDSNYVYAIWDRSRFPSDRRELHSISGFPPVDPQRRSVLPDHRRWSDMGDAPADLPATGQPIRYRPPDRGSFRRNAGRRLHAVPRLRVEQDGPGGRGDDLP